MRILISHPYYWPYVRRGAERFIHELAQYLSEQEHGIEIITSKPGRSRTIVNGDTTVHYAREFRSPLLYKLGITSDLTFAKHAFGAFLKRKYDLVHSFFYSDGLAADLCGSLKDIRYVMTFAGLPVETVYRKLPLHNFILRKAFEYASAIILYSHAARDYLLEGYKKEGIVIYGGIDTSKFFVVEGKDLDRPKVLCTASVVEQRKNVALLIEAFELFKSKVPNALLQLSGHVDSQSAKRLLNSVKPEYRESIHILGTGKVRDLPRLYAEAAFTVLPSVHEAFGFVLVESLASGTPVVGTSSGGIPEIIADPSIGVLYKPDRTDAVPTNSGDLCDCMLQALELARDNRTPGRCREYAQKYDWSVVGPQFEEVYRRVMDR